MRGAGNPGKNPDSSSSNGFVSEGKLSLLCNTITKHDIYAGGFNLICLLRSINKKSNYDGGRLLIRRHAKNFLYSFYVRCDDGIKQEMAT